MAYLVSHPDEVKVVSKRFGLGATNLDRYLELDGYKALQKALDDGAGRHHQRGEGVEPARSRRRGIPDRVEMVVRAQAVGQAEVCAVQRRRERARHLQRPSHLRARSALHHRRRDDRRTRRGRQDRLHLPARRVPLPDRDHGEGGGRRLRARLHRQEHLRLGRRSRHLCSLRRRCLRSRRRVGADGVAGRQARHSAYPSSLPCGCGSVGRPDGHQQCRVAGQRAAHHPWWRRVVRQSGHAEKRRHAPVLHERRAGAPGRVRAAHGLQPEEDDLRRLPVAWRRARS